MAGPRTLLMGAVAGVLFTVATFGTGWHFGAAGERTEALKTLNENQQAWEAQRNELQSIITVSAEAYAKRQATAEGAADRALADLRSGNIKLRVKLADAVVASVTGCGGTVSDGRAELHPETAKALVRITQDADSQIQYLQDVIRGITR